MHEYTLYRFYHKKTEELYGYTITKEFYKRFLKERNPKCFVVEKTKISEIEFMVYDNMHQEEKLGIINLTASNGDYIEIIGSRYEELRLYNEMEEIYSIEDYIRESLTYSPINKKYLKAIYNLVFYSKENKPMINSLALFATIFKDTFEEE